MNVLTFAELCNYGINIFIMLISSCEGNEMSYWVTFQRKTQKSLISNNKWNRHFVVLLVTVVDIVCRCLLLVSISFANFILFFSHHKGLRLWLAESVFLFWIAQLHPINHSISKERVGSIYHWRNDECFHENLVGWLIWFLNFLMKICLRFIIVNVMTQGCKT